ncbi:putative Histidine kinase [Candidatus Sulfotelmatomonas gaucii]|uniref:histidine kinase n=1 Tax=Candidatus Sulfuritelmatomonas gaucii TaxID=2043161 RepID=A0A2N9M331_9BACT|nr:putative Histidine kinase [Candidatus Sulfotelmatomonas gaucii]
MRTTPSIERIEAQTFRRQQIAFCILTLFVIAILLLLHTLFAPLLGEPSKAVILVLALGFLLKIWETMWLQGRRQGITAREAHLETAISIVGIFVLAVALAFFTDRDDAPYFVLLAIPILQCAYHCGLLATIATIVAAVGTMFAWIQHYFSIHPPARPTEYLETGMIAVIFCLTGPLVWFLINQLKEREAKLHEKVTELEAAREKLVSEEKLAAVGRFASGIAHEIRNPVAMIASSLATAAYPASDSREREEMFAIAAREVKRLESLTTDFLTYARPSAPQRSLMSIGDIVRHIADVTKMRAADRSIEVICQTGEETFAEIDGAQIEGALLNLSLNALDATPAGGRVKLQIRGDESMVYLDVENSGRAIPDLNLTRVFEPFFTTKPDGTGLGLAIARGIAVAHGGDLCVSDNRDGAVVFTITVPKSSLEAFSGEASHGKDSDNRR